MKKIISLILSIFISLGTFYAQTSFKLNPFPKKQVSNSTGDLNILAVLVEFDEDNDGNTFGNGKFGSIYSQDYGNDILDPLPHNADYFSSHLKFAKNYYTKVSDGKLNVNYTVLPNVITVSKIMREYSPEPGSESLENIGSFAEEVWSLTDQAYPDIQFSDYDMFVIFHAGVGREIPTPGSIGLERDIPSVYLSKKALQDIFGTEFQGFPVQDGNFFIKNTSVLPSTENREIESFGETYLQEFTINGLIVGTIASHIGLPDLFDTETGLSAIGRFGLMDGQALFAYSGLFPPEPSAWEKAYLGWIQPREVELESQSLSLTAYEVASDLEYSVVKIPINANEYYLIENRKRDANKDGITLTYQIGSSENTINLDKDYTSFSPFGVDTISGIVTDVDEFDWALPGFEDEQTFDDPFSDVGLIIWHIDETVINQKIDSNTINNNQDRLGVRVVEADGIFDIGAEFTNIFGETVIGEGTKQDTWYQNNPSEFYENKFNANTKPPAITNLGANSLISIDNISSIGNVMTFDLSFSESEIQPILTKKLFGEAVQLSQASEFLAVRKSDGSIQMIGNEGNELGDLNNFASTDIATFSDEGSDYVIGAYDDSLKVFVRGIMMPFSTIISEQLSSNVSAPIVVIPGTPTEILVGLENGTIAKFSFAGASPSELNLIESYSAFQNKPVLQISEIDQFISAISDDEYWDMNGSNISFSNTLKQLANTTMSENGLESSVENISIILGDNEFFIIKNGTIGKSFIVNSLDGINSFSLADLNSDGNNYIIFNNDFKLEARNFNGALAELFPYESENNTMLSNTPLILDFNSDEINDVFTFDINGNIYAIDGNNVSLFKSFPISSGSLGFVQPIIYNSALSRLCLVDEENNLYLWKLSNSQLSVEWGNKFRSSTNSGSLEFASETNKPEEFFPKDKAYNWPNPVYEDETYIRFYVSENADVKIKIFDLAGDLVDEIEASAAGGIDNEIAWNVNDIQSGVYFAHLNVSSTGGNSDSKIIKIAVIK